VDFSSVFFLVAGLGLDLRAPAAEPLWIPRSVCGFNVIKAPVTEMAVRAFGVPVREAIEVGLLLGQDGEFAFIVIGIALDKQLGECRIVRLAQAVLLQISEPESYLVREHCAIDPFAARCRARPADERIVDAVVIREIDVVLRNRDGMFDQAYDMHAIWTCPYEFPQRLLHLVARDFRSAPDAWRPARTARPKRQCGRRRRRPRPVPVASAGGR
jgi:Kef-type K+ transport system membrane component KefB